MSPEEHSRLEDWATKYAVLALLGFLSTLLVGGKIVHHLLLYRGLVCRVAVVPPAVISGVFGLVWLLFMDSVDPIMTRDLLGGLDALKLNLVNFVFASFILGLCCSRTSSQHLTLRGRIASILHEGMPMTIYSQILTWGQSTVCIALCCLLSIFNASTPSLFSAMVPLGIEAGVDVVPTAVMKNNWSQTVVQEAESLGLFAACIAGIVALSYRQYYKPTKWMASNRQAQQYTESQVNLNENEAFGRFIKSSSPRLIKRSKSFTTPHPIDTSSTEPPPSAQKSKLVEFMSLGTHLSVLFLSVFVAFNIGLFARVFESQVTWLQSHRILSGIRMFELSLFSALLIIHTILNTTTVKFRTDWFLRLCGLMLDMVVIASIASALPKPQNLEQVNYGLVSLFVIACVAWNIFVFYYLARIMFPNYWYERGVILSADALGHSYIGLLFARGLDPAMETPVPTAYACKLLLFLIPSSGSKNTIVVSFVNSHGLWVALAVCLTVLFGWGYIFDKYFRARFVNSDDIPADDGLEMMRRASDAPEKHSVPHDLEFEDVESSNLISTSMDLEMSPSHDSQVPEQHMLKSSRVFYNEVSSIISTHQMQILQSWLPVGDSTKNWICRYSLRRDGASLESVTNLCCPRRENGVSKYSSFIIIVEDSWGYVFGGYAGHCMENTATYYGNGEDFVFSLLPRPAAYKWTGQNDFFVISSHEQLAMGGGGNGFAFQLDDELNTGVSSASATYNNPPLSSNEYFKCLNLEVWTLENVFV